MKKLKCLTHKAHDLLLTNIKENNDNYQNSKFNFIDLIGEDGLIDIEIDFDDESLQKLNPNTSPINEYENSLLVWDALNNLDPSIASSSRLWTYLTHITCYEFSHKRWIKESTSESTIKARFFAIGNRSLHTRNALSRYWWSAWIAYTIDPDNYKELLESLYSKADVQMHTIERSGIFRNKNLAYAILKYIKNNKDNLQSDNINPLMVLINLKGSGIVFEALSDDEIYNFVDITGKELKLK